MEWSLIEEYTGDLKWSDQLFHCYSNSERWIAVQSLTQNVLWKAKITEPCHFKCHFSWLLRYAPRQENSFMKYALSSQTFIGVGLSLTFSFSCSNLGCYECEHLVTRSLGWIAALVRTMTQAYFFPLIGNPSFYSPLKPQSAIFLYHINEGYIYIHSWRVTAETD